jgi:hypothetical protein
MKTPSRGSIGIGLILISMGLAAGPFPAARPQKMDQLLVYGQGFMFGVREPDGWHGDTERAASLKVNILFYPEGHRGKPPEGMIRVGIYDKKDENTAEDLRVDMDGHRRKTPGVRFEDFDAPHGLYASFPKLFFVEGDFHEYVAYVNPGKGFWYLFSVALSTGKRPASGEELDAFRAVTASLVAMGGRAKTAPGPSGFDEALRSAEANLDRKNGRKYDTAFARKAGPWLSKALAACTKGLPDADLAPFTVLIRVSASGKPEEVLVRPATKVALCLRPSFVSAQCPKPPGPAWWVKMGIAIR